MRRPLGQERTAANNTGHLEMFDRQPPKHLLRRRRWAESAEGALTTGRLNLGLSTIHNFKEHPSRINTTNAPVSSGFIPRYSVSFPLTM